MHVAEHVDDSLHTLLGNHHVVQKHCMYTITRRCQARLGRQAGLRIQMSQYVLSIH